MPVEAEIKKLKKKTTALMKFVEFSINLNTVMLTKTYMTASLLKSLGMCMASFTTYPISWGKA